MAVMDFRGNKCFNDCDVRRYEYNPSHLNVFNNTAHPVINGWSYWFMWFQNPSSWHWFYIRISISGDNWWNWCRPVVRICYLKDQFTLVFLNGRSIQQMESNDSYFVIDAGWECGYFHQLTSAPICVGILQNRLKCHQINHYSVSLFSW